MNRNNKNPYSILDKKSLWVALKEHKRVNGSYVLPYGAAGKRAKLNDPRTWLTRDAALQLCKSRTMDGVGIFIGKVANDSTLAVVDIENCRGPRAKFEPWAQALIDKLDSYTEVSPNKRGVRIYFFISEECWDQLMMPELLFGGFAMSWKKSDAGLHPPGVKLYSDRRYFAVTAAHVRGTPDNIRSVSNRTLQWLIDDAPMFLESLARRKRRTH